MRKKTKIETARAAMLIRARAEGSVVRMRWLNEVVPALEAEFDRRLTTGESTDIVVPSMNDFVAEAMQQIEQAQNADYAAS